MKTFRKLFDSSEPIVLSGLSLEEQYESLGMYIGYSFSSYDVDDEIRKKIKDAIDNSINKCEGKCISKQAMSNLFDAFYFNVNLNHIIADKKYLFALQCINDIGGNQTKEFVPFTEEDKWTEALKWLKSYMLLHKLPDDEKTYISESNQKLRVKAITRLIKKGLQFEITENNIIEFNRVNLVVLDICNRMKAIGGVRFANEFLKHAKYNNQTSRLLFPRCQSGHLTNLIPEVPVGYLLNLAFRMISSKGSGNGLAKHYKSIINDATDLCMALFPNLASYGINDMICNDPLDYMEKWINYNSIIDVQQMSGEFGLDLMNFLLDEIENDGRKIADTFSVSEYKALMNELVNLSKPKEFVQIDQSMIKSVGGQLHSIIKLISSDCINGNFQDPLDYDKVNYMESAIILLPNKDLLLYPRSIGMIGWYEKMMTLLREQDKIVKDRIEKERQAGNTSKQKYVEIDNFVGLLLEDYVVNTLKSKGISSKSGEYAAKGTTGECDIVVENEKIILLMELKKKNITRAARMGYKYQIVLDFVGSLLNSQEQAFRTETLLRQNQKLTLKEKVNTTELEYNNRSFEKITVTLNEYGPLHERCIQQKVLECFINYKYWIKPDEIRPLVGEDEKLENVVKAYQSLDKKQKKLNDFLSDLLTVNAISIDNPFFDSWFFSIEQLCYIINSSSDVDDFIDKLHKLKYSSFCTKDFWMEYEMKMSMH